MEPKLVRVKRLDTIRLDGDDGSTYYTAEGYLIDHPILTSCGIFEYRNDDGSIRRELRLPQHVFDEKSLESYRGKPIILTHEAGVVNKDNVSDEEVGTILSAGYQDGNDVRAEIIIHDTDAMKRSGLKELSLGYNLDLIEQPGVYNGMPYDAIQTNIVVNHLALVRSARAGEQARLNIDGSDEPTLKGGKAMAMNKDEALTPDELKEAIEAYKAKKALEAKSAKEEEPTEVTPAKEDSEKAEEPKANKDSEDTADANEGEVKAETNNDGDNNGEVIALLKKVIGLLENKPLTYDNADSCMKKDGDTEEMNDDSSDNESNSMNMDSKEDSFEERLAVVRLGDRLNLDGIDKMSVKDGKKAIVSKVLPNMRLDGKSDEYIDAAFELALGEVNQKKDVDYQRKQMMSGNPAAMRADGNDNVSMASMARQRMLDRENS